MSERTILIGNGLGLALDSDMYSLQAGIQRAWNFTDRNGASVLTDEAKRRICLLTSNGDINHPPDREEQLLELQRVISACNFLHSIENDSFQWLDDNARQFPRDVQLFISLVAYSFNNTELQLPAAFLDALCEKIKRAPTNIATLNYDNLLYQALIEREILKGYDGNLVDGILDAGFKPENLTRKYNNVFGLYLHLHGSPLFYDTDGVIKKIRPRDLLDRIIQNNDHENRHIVLTHFKFKPFVINQSVLLSTYWDFFRRSLFDSDDLTVFGYGGFDKHVNELISEWFSNTILKQIRIIEWENPQETQVDREGFWFNKFSIHTSKRNLVEVIRLNNILEWNWADLPPIG